MSFKNFISELNGERVEGSLYFTIFISLAISFLTFGVLYYLKLKYIENFIPKYGFFIFLLILSYSIIVSGIRQVSHYRQFSCMSGMMVGMTLGMISGFLPGFFMGATNGMFWGSVFGIIIGLIIGVWAGKCCGIMGIMEGLMAGFMGGLMGAMTSVMMINDNLKIAGILVFLVSATIIFCLNYMVYFEMKEVNEKVINFNFETIILSFLFTIISLVMVVFGPKGVLFQ